MAAILRRLAGLEQYLELLDWTGRQTPPDKRGQIWRIQFVLAKAN